MKLPWQKKEPTDAIRERMELLFLYLNQPDRDRSAVIADGELLARAMGRYAESCNQTLYFMPESFTELAELIYYIGYLRGLFTGKLEAAYPEH